jgi:hypothetical protein
MILVTGGDGRTSPISPRIPEGYESGSVHQLPNPEEFGEMERPTRRHCFGYTEICLLVR